MISWRKKEEPKDFVLVRVCIGCVLPNGARLIGHGSYPFLVSGKGKTTEQYYDYEINEEDLETFLQINSELLIKYNLLEVPKVEKPEDKNPVKPTTTRGWTKKS